MKIHTAVIAAPRSHRGRSAASICAWPVMRAAPMAIRCPQAPPPTRGAKAGRKHFNTTINARAPQPTGFLEMGFLNAPKSAGRMLSKRAGLAIPAPGARRLAEHARAMTSVVTIELEAMAMVEITLASSAPGGLWQPHGVERTGTFRLVRLPVTSQVPDPVPSMGTGVNLNDAYGHYVNFRASSGDTAVRGGQAL